MVNGQSRSKGAVNGQSTLWSTVNGRLCSAEQRYAYTLSCWRATVYSLSVENWSEEWMLVVRLQWSIDKLLGKAPRAVDSQTVERSKVNSLKSAWSSDGLGTRLGQTAEKVWSKLWPAVAVVTTESTPPPPLPCLGEAFKRPTTTLIHNFNAHLVSLRLTSPWHNLTHSISFPHSLWFWVHVVSRLIPAT